MAKVDKSVRKSIESHQRVVRIVSKVGLGLGVLCLVLGVVALAGGGLSGVMGNPATMQFAGDDVLIGDYVMALGILSLIVGVIFTGVNAFGLKAAEQPAKFAKTYKFVCVLMAGVFIFGAAGNVMSSAIAPMVVCLLVVASYCVAAHSADYLSKYV